MPAGVSSVPLSHRSGEPTSLPGSHRSGEPTSVGSPPSELLTLPETGAVTSLADRAVCEGRLFATYQNQLDALEEKLSRQLSNFQRQLAQQSKRLVEAVLQPMEAKVSAIEGRERKIDCQLSDLNGSVKALMLEVQLQAQRAEKSDSKLRHWRKIMEDLKARFEQIVAADAGHGGVRKEALAVQEHHGGTMTQPESLRLELGQANLRHELDVLGQRYNDLEARLEGNAPVQENDMRALDLVAELRGDLQTVLERTQNAVGKVEKVYHDAEEMTGGPSFMEAMNSRIAKQEERHKSLEAEVRNRMPPPIFDRMPPPIFDRDAMVEEQHKSLEPEVRSRMPPPKWERDVMVEQMWQATSQHIEELGARVTKLELARPRDELVASSLVHMGMDQPSLPPTHTVPWPSDEESSKSMEAMQKELLKLKASVQEHPLTSSAMSVSKEEIEPDLVALWSSMSDLVDVVQTALPGADNSDAAAGVVESLLPGGALAEGIKAKLGASTESESHAIPSGELSKVWATLGAITELMDAGSTLDGKLPSSDKLPSNGHLNVASMSRPRDVAEHEVVQDHGEHKTVEHHHSEQKTVEHQHSEHKIVEHHHSEHKIVEHHSEQKIVQDRSLSNAMVATMEDAVATAARDLREAHDLSAVVAKAGEELSNEVAELQAQLHEMVDRAREEQSQGQDPALSTFPQRRAKFESSPEEAPHH